MSHRLILTRIKAEPVHQDLTFAAFGLYFCDAMPNTSGFTETDLALLSNLRSARIARRHWSRAHVVHGPSADYLAAWNADAGNAGPPHLTIARFKRTGTYALTIGALVVATAASLHKILPTFDDEPEETAIVA